MLMGFVLKEMVMQEHLYETEHVVMISLNNVTTIHRQSNAHLPE